MWELYTAVTLVGRIANAHFDLLLLWVRISAFYCFLKKYFWISDVFVFTCRAVWIKCCLLPTHVQIRSCKSSSVLREGILIWISNHMGKSHTGSNVASSSTVCSLLSQIHSNSQQWLTRCVLCTLTPGGVARTAHLVVMHKPGSLFFTDSYKLTQMPSAESQWTVWKHGFQNSGALEQILSWSSCPMHLFLKESA